MLKKLLAGAVVAGLLAISPALAQTATDTSAPAAAAIDKAVKPPPKHMKHKKAVKKHKTSKSSSKHKQPSSMHKASKTTKK